MSQNGGLEANWSGTFWMCPSRRPQCTTLGKNWGNFGNIARKCQENWKTGNILNEPSIFPKFPRFLPNVVHWGHLDGYIQNVPLWFTSSTPFWLILDFTGWEHCDHTTGNTAKNSLNEPLRNITGAFFGKIQDVPITFPMGTPQSHDLGHCEHTARISWMSHSGTLQLHSLGKFRMSPLCNWWEHCNHVIWDTVNVLAIPQAREIAGTLAGKILNGLVMYWVGTCMVLCLFPCKVLVMYWLGTLALAPSVYSSKPLSSNVERERKRRLMPGM